MLGRTVKGYYLNVCDDEEYAVEFKFTLKELLARLKTDLITMPAYQIGDYKYRIVCAQVVKAEWKLSALNFKDEVELNGNLMVMGMDEEGEARGLTDDEVDNLRHHIRIVQAHTKNGKSYNTYCLLHLVPLKLDRGIVKV